MWIGAIDAEVAADTDLAQLTPVNAVTGFGIEVEAGAVGDGDRMEEAEEDGDEAKGMDGGIVVVVVVVVVEAAEATCEKEDVLFHTDGDSAFVVAPDGVIVLGVPVAAAAAVDPFACTLVTCTFVTCTCRLTFKLMLTVLVTLVGGTGGEEEEAVDGPPVLVLVAFGEDVD